MKFVRSFRLRLMCRNQSDQAAFVYKPLGVLKRSMVERPTYGETLPQQALCTVTHLYQPVQL